MVVPPAPAGYAGVTDTTSDSTTRRSTRIRLGLLVAMVLAIVVSMAVFGWAAATRSIDALGLTGTQDQVQSDREEVMAQASQFLLRMGTYGPDLLDDNQQMPKYRASVTEVITPKFATSFEEQASVAEQLVAQAGQSRKATVFGSGVSEIDEDSATALVAGSFTDSYGDAEPQAPSAFRMEVSLVKVDGTWLVDDFSPLLRSQQPAPQEQTPGDDAPEGEGEQP